MTTAMAIRHQASVREQGWLVVADVGRSGTAGRGLGWPAFSVPGPARSGTCGS